MRLKNLTLKVTGVMKISSWHLFASFACVFVITSNVLARDIIVKRESSDSLDNYDQVFLYNEYIIDQLTELSHVLKRQPVRLGSQISGVDTSLLVFKLNSLNFLISSTIGGHSSSEYLDETIKQPLSLDDHELLLQSRELLKSLPGVFHKYDVPAPIDFGQYITTRWYAHNVTGQHLYKQFLRIESILNGLKVVVKPKDVYQVVFSTQSLLLSKCATVGDIAHQPLIMGKRPKDVYFRLIDYLALLSYSAPFEPSSDRPVRVLPQDVFDLAVVSLAYSSGLLSEEDYSSITERSNFTSVPPVADDATIITPSHVYRSVSENIALLECQSHVGN